MKLLAPGHDGLVHIPPDGTPPPLPFVSDAPGPHRWDWRVAWRHQVAHGSTSTPHGRWDARPAIGVGGGLLDVVASAGTTRGHAVVTLSGTNPTPTMVAAYLATKPNAHGFDQIVAQESRCRHFADDGGPVVSFDGGVGLCQLTHPPATLAQAWNWRANLDAGLALFAAKRVLAVRHLGQGGRSFTPEQATREAVCLWNGGFYHVWDGSGWVRPTAILCDRRAGNIGWDMTNPANRGRHEADLHARDAASYAAGHGADWHYYGVCYADRILGA